MKSAREILEEKAKKEGMAFSAYETIFIQECMIDYADQYVNEVDKVIPPLMNLKEDIKRFTVAQYPELKVNLVLIAM